MSIFRFYVALFSAAFCLLAFGHTAWSQAKYSHTGPTIISGIRVIDGLGNAPKENQDILVSGGKIAGIGPYGSLDAPADAFKIDGAGMTAMPGLIDMHVHLQGGWANASVPGDKYAIKWDDESVQQRLSGYLYAGVTTMQDVGADHEWIVRMRERVNGGELLGPRLFVSGAVWSQAPSGSDAAAAFGADTDGSEGEPNPVSTKVTDIAKIPEQMDRYPVAQAAEMPRARGGGAEVTEILTRHGATVLSLRHRTTP